MHQLLKFWIFQDDYREFATDVSEMGFNIMENALEHVVQEKEATYQVLQSYLSLFFDSSSSILKRCCISETVV